MLVCDTIDKTITVLMDHALMLKSESCLEVPRQPAAAALPQHGSSVAAHGCITPSLEQVILV